MIVKAVEWNLLIAYSKTVSRGNTTNMVLFRLALSTYNSLIGRSLIRTFLAGAPKDAAICLVSEEQAQNKKLSLDLVLSERMITFALDDEP